MERNNHIEVITYTCSVCNASFNKQKSLYRHLNIHEEKKYQCYICEAKFVNKYNMQRHIKTHLKIKDFL